MKLLLWLLLIAAILAKSESTRDDIDCLRSIKESLQDPLNSLSTWQFDSWSKSYTDDFFCKFHGIQCWKIPDLIQEGHSIEKTIQKIDLSGLGLRGEFPRHVSRCPSLTILNLSRNHLHGSLPSDIWSLNLVSLTDIDLSFNRFSGEVPSYISNCSYLNVLNLNDNLLTGRIPTEIVLLWRLKSFSVANNRLSGPVPRDIFLRFGPKSFENNSGLCGEPLDPCRSSGWTADFVNGFLGGWAIFFLLFLLLGLFVPLEKFFLKFKRSKGATNNPGVELFSSTDRTDRNTQMTEHEKFVPSMILAELKKATDGFSQIHVTGSVESGTIYKAVLKNDWHLTIKRLHPLHSDQEFLSEIAILSRIKHNNLVPLLGFCDELNERMLIYEFESIGSLYDLLFSFNDDSMVMEWPVKVKIAVGVAKGIAWLHQNGVVHRGITSKCVLLDQILDPKISEFGRATTALSAKDATHFGNWEGLSWNREFVVPSCYVEDVYGFGVVLLELITMKKHRDLMDDFESIGGDLVDVVSHLIKMRMEEQEIDHDDPALHLLRIARKCVECEPRKWPSMVEVHQMLIRLKTIMDDSSKNECELIEM